MSESPIIITVNSQQAIIDLRDATQQISNFKPVLKTFGVYMINRSKETFRALGKGGTFRGVNWPPFADQYQRKDGTIIPAQGGIPKIKGKGLVKGRLRPSGKRVTASSQLLRDTGQLMASIGHGMKIDNKGLHIATAKNYGAAQQERRPFLFFELPRDIEALRGFAIERIKQITQNLNRHKTNG